MDLGDIVVAMVCLLWVAVCAGRWWITPSSAGWQRHFFAVAAGLGAALFWIFGQLVWDLIFPTPKPLTGKDIRVAPVESPAAVPKP